MNDNQNNNYNGQGNSDGEKEQIRFDEADFNNPYSSYYSNQRTGGGFGSNGGGCDWNPYTEKSDNPYSKNYREKKDDAFCSELCEQEKHKKHFSRIGLGYALLSVITLIVVTIVAAVVRYVDPEFYSSTLFLNLLTPLALYVFSLPVLLIILSGCEAKTPEKRHMGFGEWMLFLIASFGFMYIGSIVGNSVMTFLSELVGYDYGNALESIIDDENLLVTAFFTVIVAPIGEEIIFRKLMIDRTQKYGPVISIGLSGLVFGLMHGNFYQFFYCFALGIILGYMYYTTGKLYLTIAIHATVNFFGSIVTSLLTPVSDALMELDTTDPAAILEIVMEQPWAVAGFLAFTLFVYAAMACAVIFPLAFRKKLKSRLVSGEVSIPRGRVIQTVILNGGMIAMLVIYLLEFGLNLIPL